MTDSPTNRTGFPRWPEVVATLLRQRRLILTVALIGTIACAVVVFLRAPVYEAHAHLAVVPERARIIVSPDPKTGTLSEGVNEQDLNSEVALLRSDQLLREVLEARAGDQAPPVARAALGAPIDALLDAPGWLYRVVHGVPSDALEWEIRDVRERLDIEGIKGSNLIRVRYRADHPEEAAGLVNALAERHVRRPAITSQDDARRFFEGQREVLYDSRRQAERKLREFYERENIGPLPESVKALRTQLIEQHTRVTKTRTSLAEAEARIAYLRAELERRPDTVAGRVRGGGDPQSDPLQFIRTRIVELELKRNNLLGQFAPTSGRIRDIDRQLKHARTLQAREEARAHGVLNETRETLSLALAKTEAEAEGLRARVRSLEEQINRDEPRLAHLENIAPERERLEQEVASAREALQTYRRKEEEARFSSALDQSRIVNVSIVEPARVPTTPLPAARIAATSLGGMLSLLAGMGLALVRDRFNPTIRSVGDAEETGHAAVLADLTY